MCKKTSNKKGDMVYKSKQGTFEDVIRSIKQISFSEKRLPGLWDLYFLKSKKAVIFAFDLPVI